MANEFVARNGIIAQNNTIITGSLTVTSNVSASSFTGSIFGTASVSISSSFASNTLTASYVNLAQTASYVKNAQTASYVAGAGTAVNFPSYPSTSSIFGVGNRAFIVGAYSVGATYQGTVSIVNQDKIIINQIYVASPVTVKSIGRYQASVAATGSFRFGLYSSSLASSTYGAFGPGNLIQDLGTVNIPASTAGYYSVSFNPTLSLSQGTYWLACAVSQSSYPVSTAANNTLIGCTPLNIVTGYGTGAPSTNAIAGLCPIFDIIANSAPWSNGLTGSLSNIQFNNTYNGTNTYAPMYLEII